MKLYLSGPMTGLPDLNYPAFINAAHGLRAIGHEVYNPAEWENNNNGGQFNLLFAFQDYCHYIIRIADAVVTLPGWEKSPGATAETSLARAISKPVYTFEEILEQFGNVEGSL